MKYLIIGSLVIGLCSVSSVFAEESKGEIIKATPLKTQPKNTSKTLANLKSSQKIRIKKRQGGWYQLDAGLNINGWVRMLAVRFYKAPYRPGKSGLGATLSSIRSGHSGITATTGVRGLNSESLVNAKADFKQLEKMLALTVKPNQANKFAKDAGLTTTSIKYFEVEK